jgi:hypothetical protein
MKDDNKKIEMIILNEDTWGHSPRYLLKRCVISFRIYDNCFSMVYDINHNSENFYIVNSPWFLYNPELSEKFERHHTTLTY